MRLPSYASCFPSLDIYLLKPSGLFMYQHVEHSKILRGARFALFCTDLRTDRNLCFKPYQIIGFNRGGKCLQHGTD
jgi:hypothetical protein